MVDYLNQFLDVIQQYVNFIFSLYVAPSVSLGSIFLLSTLLWIIVANFWPRQ